ARKSPLCRTSCGPIPINYPFGIDNGCGSPYYQNLLICTDSAQLQLRTPSGIYPVHNISYTDPHLIVTDPYMWACGDGLDSRPVGPFSLDTSTRLRLSRENDYLFFNCSERDVIMEPKPVFCNRFPEQCDSTNLPGCASALRGSTCCSYYPKGSESIRMMMRHCSSYTSVYWRNLGTRPDFDQIPEYGIRVEFEIPVTTRCLLCQDRLKGGGTCGFDTRTQDFLGEHNRPAVVAGTVSAVSVVGVFAGAGIWYVRKMRAKSPVTHGVQTNDNRLF
ncbi:wall-associated kinase family protein, partial [Striga asiatica]